MRNREYDRLEAENYALHDEIDAWKEASGLECGGDPDGVAPAAAKKHWDRLAAEVERLKREIARLEIAERDARAWFHAACKERDCLRRRLAAKLYHDKEDET